MSLRFSDLWRFFSAQGLAFQAMCFYLVVEYVRPQQILGIIKGLPLGQIVLGIALLAYLMSNPRFSMKGLGSWLLLLFTAVIFASSLNAYMPDVSFGAIRVWVSWVVIYFLIINIVNTPQRFLFFTGIWLLCHLYMAQGGTRQFVMRGFRFASWGLTGAPGWFENSGEFGIAMGMFVAISWHFYVAAKPYLQGWRKWVMLSLPAMGALCVIGSSSRGAVAGMVGIGLIMFLRMKFSVRNIAGLAVAAAAVWFILPAEQKARFNSAGTDGTSMSRKVYWLNGLDIAKNNPTLGIGYENWLRYYAEYYRYSPISDKYDVHTVQVAHNIFIQCMAELGYIGLAAFILLIGGTLLLNYQTRKAARASPGPASEPLRQMAYALDEAMVCYLIAGFFVTVLYYPFFWINLAMTVSLHAVAVARPRIALPSRPRFQRRAAPPSTSSVPVVAR